MHRNTYLLIIFLAVFAALVVIVNFKKHLDKIVHPPLSTVVTPTNPPVALKLNPYTNAICGISFSYPDGLTKLENASGSAIFMNTASQQDSLAVTCQKNIPRPALAPDKIESKYLTDTTGTASVSAKIYHDTSAKDGTPVDALIFTNPHNGMDIYVGGFGDAFNQAVASIKLNY